MSNSGVQFHSGVHPQKATFSGRTSGTGRHYNINSKRGNLNLLFCENGDENSIYSTDLAAYVENLDAIEEMSEEYVVIVPSYMVYTADYEEFLQNHIESGADITLMYQNVDNAKDHFLNCQVLNLNKQKACCLWNQTTEM